MISKSFPVCALIAAATLLTGTVGAEGTSIRLDVGRSDIKALDVDDSTAIVGFTLGQVITDNIRAEIGFRDLGGFTAKRTGTVAVNELNAEMFELGIAGQFPLTDVVPGFYLEARVGMGFFDVDGKRQAVLANQALGPIERYKASGNKLYYGVGAGYQMTDSFAMGLSFAEYSAEQKFGTETKGIDFPTLSVNATFRF
jgi:hypothetical protein